MERVNMFTHRTAGRNLMGRCGVTLGAAARLAALHIGCRGGVARADVVGHRHGETKLECGGGPDKRSASGVCPAHWLSRTSCAPANGVGAALVRGTQNDG